MIKRVVAPTSGINIVEKNGAPTPQMREWLNKTSSIIAGDVVPEGVIEANETQLYMDNTGTTGSILYIKKLADIGGDKTKGWVLV